MPCGDIMFDTAILKIVPASTDPFSGAVKRSTSKWAHGQSYELEGAILGSG